MNDNTLKLFAGNAHPALAQEVAEHLKMNLGISTVKRFRDGEIAVNIDEAFAAPTSILCNRLVPR